MNGERLPPPAPVVVVAAPRVAVPRRSLSRAWGRERRAFAMPMVASAVGLVVGATALFTNSADRLAAPAAAAIAVAVLAAVGDRYRRERQVDRSGVLIAVFAGLVALGLVVAPEYLYGAQVNGVIHRSAISGPVLLLISCTALGFSLRRLLGNTPSARDISLYPWLTLPVALAFVAYGLLLARVVI